MLHLMLLITCVLLLPFACNMLPCRIVLENSGVAEPQNIRDLFNEAMAAGHPLMQRVELDTLVTLVDSSSFIKDYSTK
jgi:G3E family GTPase